MGETWAGVLEETKCDPNERRETILAASLEFLGKGGKLIRGKVTLDGKLLEYSQ